MTADKFFVKALPYGMTMESLCRFLGEMEESAQKSGQTERGILSALQCKTTFGQDNERLLQKSWSVSECSIAVGLLARLQFF